MAQVLHSPRVESHPFHQSSFSPGASTIPRSLSLQVPSLLYHHTLSTPSPNTPKDTSDMIDIRSSDTSLLDTLDTQSLSSLLQPRGKKSLPSLLLWDEKGQCLYDSILATPYYYPYRVENALLLKQISHIASTIASSTTDILVELGAGNLSKTALLLGALDRCLDSSGQRSGKMVYYALDVDRSLLESSLNPLRKRTALKNIELRSLLGTYEDGARWLSQPDLAPYRKTMVWLGNSIANLEKGEASALLTKFAGQNGVQNLAGFLLGVDGCLDQEKVERAYNAPGGENKRWVLHALEAAGEQLRLSSSDSGSDDMFDEKNWRFEGRWDSERQRYENYLVPLRRMEAVVHNKEGETEKVVLEEGEKVFVLGSGKWTERDVQEICEKGPGLELRRSWHSEGDDYGVYWLQPGKKRLDSGIEMEDDEE
ncbi:histidine-specific methyltransferase [Copromyces sp. CBS 386.78]|nr:histidine-specific methyltransferase [Copromyces sp. CBS 386.78]